MKQQGVFSKLNNVWLIIFVIAINFESWQPLGLKGIISIATIVAFFYLLTCLPFLSQMKMRALNPYFIPLIIYFFIEFFSSVINNIYVLIIVSAFDFRLLQMFILLVFLSDHLRRNPQIIQKVFNAFSLSVALLGILSYFDIGVDIDLTEQTGRLLLFGENPNIVGMKSGFAILMTVDFLISVKTNNWIRKAVSILVIIPLIYLLIKSGSRGALLSVFSGLFLIILLQKVSFKRKLVLSVLGVIGSIWLLSFIMKNEQRFEQRISMSLETGYTGRNDIWDASYKIIVDHPFIGVGPLGELPVMKTYLGREKDPHNVFLYVLITTGIFGFIFFMTFLVRIAIALIKKYRYDKNILYIALFIALILNMAKAGGFINAPLLWFFLSIFIGVTLPHKNRNKQTKQLEIFNRAV